MAKRRKSRKRRTSVKRRTTLRRNPVKRRRRRVRRSYVSNPVKRKARKGRKRSKRRGGIYAMHRALLARAGMPTRRKRRKTSRRRKARRSSYSRSRYLARRRAAGGIRSKSPKQLRARRRNIRKALNKRYGVRRWKKHSTAKWNPGTALSLGGFARSVKQTFSVEMLKDGAAIAGGIVGALALPGILQRFLPTAITSRVSLTTGWTGYIANFASAGIVGYLAGVALGQNVGRKVLYGGLGAAMAKLLLDKVPGLSSRTGVTLGGNSELDRLVEQEIAAELATGANMGAYLAPGQALTAQALGAYVGPENVAAATNLGGVTRYPEFGEFEDAALNVEF